MPFKTGNKLAGNRKGIPNKKTAQWEVFSEYCLNGGLQRFTKELNRLEGKEYVTSFCNLLEYFKPKLSRQQCDLTSKDEKIDTIRVIELKNEIEEIFEK